MSSLPVVSVVVPCYRQAAFLPEALESVRAQTLGDWECIIVNDGSPDNTAEVARFWVERDARFRYLEQGNGGLSGARNAGIRASAGAYILPLDADDRFEPSFLLKAVPVLEQRPEVGIVACYTRYFGAWDHVAAGARSGGVELYLMHPNHVASALFRRKLWEQVGGYDETFRTGYEDWDFWLAAMERGWLCHVLEEPLFLYRRKAQSMVIQADKRRPELVRRLVMKHRELFAVHVVEAIHLRERDLASQRAQLEALRCAWSTRLGNWILAPWYAGRRLAARLFRRPRSSA